MDKVLILNKLKEHKKFTTNKQFADFIGITPQNLRNWLDRNTYDINKLIAVFPEVSAYWLATGEGEMLNVPCSDTDPIKVAEDPFQYGNRQQITGNNNCNNMNSNSDNSFINALLEQLKEKDDQINRLIKIIENKG